MKVADVLDRAAEQLDADAAIPPKRRAALQWSLGNTYHALGLYPKAIPLKEKVRDYHLATSGPEHPATFAAMHNLAVSYGDAGRQDEAIKMQEEVLALSRKVIGPEHPDTLGAMGNFTMSAQAVASGMLWDGKTSEYHALTRKLLELIATSEKVEPLRRVAKIASLAPHPDAKVRKAVLARAQKARDLDEKRSVWTPMVLGMALFRNGEHAEAAQVLKNDSVGGHIGGISAYYRAMSLFQQGRQDDARSLFTVAEAVMKPLSVASEDITQMSSDNLILWLAYKEAGTLLSLPLQKAPKPIKEVLIPPDSEWKWLHPTDGIDPAQGDPDFHSTFSTTDFDAVSWQTGKDSAEAGGGFGYGDDGFKGIDIGTPSSKELGKSAYFRHRFTTTKKHTSLELRCQRDDGIIIYFDGKEVARDNMEEDAEAYLLPAANAVSNVDETTTYRIPLEILTLPAGEHVLSISLHNPGKPSSDLRIGGISLVEVETHEAK